MNKTRLIPALFLKNGFIVRSENFSQHKIIGNVVNEVQRYNQWNVDELIFIDISRKKSYDTKRDDHKIQRVKSLYEILNLVSKECFMPLSFGGGIRSLDTIKKLVSGGADKVVLNTMIHNSPHEVENAIKIYGSQAIIACVDYKINKRKIEFYINNGEEILNMSFYDMINYLEKLNVGEIFLNSIDNDGKGEGYDIQTIKRFISNTKIPIIGCGGASSIYDFKEIAKLDGISGIAAGNMFHFTENIYSRAKIELKKENLNFR